MAHSILEVHKICKRYGTFEALQNVSFHVEEGEIFGLLGPNGAGKTTLLSILACLNDPTSGEIRFEGQPLQRHDLSQRQWIGIGTQEYAFYPELTAKENLEFFGKLYGLRGSDLQKRVEEVLELAGLTERANHRCNTFSGGMRRRLNLAIAVVHRPRLLLLDEPTTGVDPQSRNHLFERALELQKNGMTIIYTSHYMEEVQTLCRRIGILDHGKLIACDTLPALLQILDGAVKLTFNQNAHVLRNQLERLPGVKVTSTQPNVLSLAGSDVSGMLLHVTRLLRETNLELVSLETHEPNLERVFLHLTDRTLRD